MPSLRPALHLKIVDDWIRLITDTQPSPESSTPLVEDLVVSIFRSVSSWFDVRAIDEKIAAWSRFDFRDTRRAMELLESAPIQSKSMQRERVRLLSEVATKLEALERIGFRPLDSQLREMSFDSNHAFERILRSVSKRWNVSQLRGLARRRISGLQRQQLCWMWKCILRECHLDKIPRKTSEDHCGFLIDKSQVVDKQFFAVSPDDSETLKDRIAAYLSWIRPQLILEGLERKRSKYPVLEFGLATILTLKDESSPSRPSEAEWTVARALGILTRVSATSARLWYAANDILALDNRGPILSYFAKPVNSELRRDRELLFALSTLLAASEELLGAPSSIVERLRWYKLRMEVSSNELLRDYASAFASRPPSETDLQRDICRFLLGHGIFAVGTSFGRSETDLVFAEGQDIHLIEAKLIKHPLTLEELRRLLPQLSSYADEFIRPPRTKCLIIFNRSDVLLTAPRELVADEYLLMFVNLLDESPSRRQQERRFRFVDGEFVMDQNVINVSQRMSQRGSLSAPSPRRRRTSGSAITSTRRRGTPKRTKMSS